LYRGTDMDWHYTYTPYIWLPFFVTLFLVALGIYAWRRRRMPGALPFTIACLFAALCAACSVMEYAALDLETRIFWFKFQAVWYIPIVTAVTCYILEYTWPGRWLTRRNLVLLSLPCLLAFGSVLTNEQNYLTWRSYEFQGTFQPQLGLVSWLFSLYGLVILAVLDLVVLGWLFLHSPQQRWPVVLVLLGQFGGRTIFLLEKANLIHSVLPIELLGIAFEFLMYAIALFGFQILDPIPLARRMVIEQMHAGMLVLDPLGKVVSSNPAAQAMLGLPGKYLLKRPIGEFLRIADESLISGQTEIRLGNGQGNHYCQLEASSLTDWRGLEVGRLLLLRDVTGQKRVQAQILEQQRSLATLQERERLAREMHDSLGQSLAATHLLAGTAKLLLGQGETAQAEKCVDQMSEMALAAEADVREYILGARLIISADQRFFEILRQYLTHFSRQYSLHVRLSIPPQLEAEGLGTAVEVQLLRIIQEALTNIRKHAQAQSTQVIFTDSEHFVQIAIIDDGRGFDPAAVAVQIQGFGLQSMRERAEALGGCLEITSQQGQGTQVLVQIKRGEESREVSINR
jgi:signal transduction histidine kinase